MTPVNNLSGQQKANQILATFLSWTASKPEPDTIIVNGYRLTKSTLIPEAMELLRPSGEHIVTLLAEGGLGGDA